MASRVQRKDVPLIDYRFSILSIYHRVFFREICSRYILMAGYNITKMTLKQHLYKGLLDPITLQPF